MYTSKSEMKNYALYSFVSTIASLECNCVLNPFASECKSKEIVIRRRGGDLFPRASVEQT